KSNKLYGRIMIRPYLYLILTSIFYISLLFTKSKSGIIACIISLILYFTIYFFQNLKNKSSFKKIFIFALIFILLTFTINNPIKDYLFPQKLKTQTTLNTAESSKILITS